MLLNNYGSRNELLLAWILETLGDPSCVLDVGAGDGSFCPEFHRIGSQGHELDGVDPDGAALARNAALRHRFVGALEEAPIPPASYDCLYAVYVFEHVMSPDAFLSAAARALKPGGSLFFITPNGDHYFARIASLLARVRLQEQVLKVLRPEQLVDAYHHPAVYRLNRPAALRRMATAHGFSRCELRFCETLEELTPYFPGPLRILPTLWEKMVAATGNERLLGNLMGRLVRGE